MNYQRQYNLLINKGKNRILTGYIEEHHIIPRAFGGSNSKENLVKLTAREHYVAHLLLWKMQTEKREKHKMAKVCIMMKGKSKFVFNSKMYESVKRAGAKLHSEMFSGKNHPMYGTSRCGKDNPFYGKTHSAETRKLISELRNGKVIAKDLRTDKKLWVSREDFEKYDYYVGMTSGDKMSEETKKKISEGLKKKPILVCPHCKKEGRGNMKRYHFDKCKYILANNFNIATL